MNSAPLGPLSIGNVVSTGLIVYRSNLRTYVGIAFRAYLWIILPLIILAVAGGLFLISNQYPWALLAIAFVLIIACIAKYQLNAALISRLAYQELINKPESVGAARQQLDSKLWRFWWVAISVGFQLFLVYILSAFASGVAIGLLILILKLDPLVGGILISITIVVAVLASLSWYIARWSIAELPLAVEGNITAGDSIKRSWDLTKNSALRVQGIVLIAFLVTIPITALTSYAPQILISTAIPGSTLFWVGTAISFVFSMLGSLLVLPLWQTIKAAIYYDLRIRREGLDMQLRQG